MSTANSALDSLEHPLWIQFLELDQRRRELEAQMAVGGLPVGRWNRFMDSYSDAMREVQRDAGLLAQIRALLPELGDRRTVA